MLIVDIRHWLNDSLTGPAVPELKNKVNKLGKIISFATDLNGNPPPLKCSCRSGRKPCPGELVVLIVEDLRIHWYCPACEDEGLISGWRGLIWDLLDDVGDVQ